jgi:hypothetical protein
MVCYVHAVFPTGVCVLSCAGSRVQSTDSPGWVSLWSRAFVVYGQRFVSWVGAAKLGDTSMSFLSARTSSSCNCACTR